MNRTLRLEKEKIGKLLIDFSLPAIIGMIVMASYNIVDRIFVGRGVGSLAISGVTITFPIIIIFIAFGMLVGVGATANVSLRLGERKIVDAEKILANAFTLSIAISIILMIIGYAFMDTFLIAFGASPDVLPYSRDYTTVLLSGTIFQSIAFTMNNIIRGEGNPKMAMKTMIIGGVFNIILNPIFIFGLHLGVKGSALATVIAQLVSAIWVMSYFFGNKSHVKFHFKYLKLEKSIVLKIFSIGMSPFSMQIAASAVTIIFMKSLAHYGGDLAIAAMGIGVSVINFILMPIFGINQGVQPIIGYNYGAKLFDRVRKVLRLATIASTLICVIGFLVVLFFSESIISIFSKNDTQLIEMGAHALRVFLFMLPVVGFQIVSAGYFQAVGKAGSAMVLTLFRQVIMLIPMILILPHFFQLEGIWLSEPVSDGVSAVLSFILISIELKRLTKLQKEQLLHPVESKPELIIQPSLSEIQGI
jgi:putative MATE family efflux protein